MQVKTLHPGKISDPAEETSDDQCENDVDIKV